MLIHLSHNVSSWLSGSLDWVSYGNRPAYIICFRTSGTPLSQTDFATQKHSSHCWWKLKNFAIHLYLTISNIMIITAVANYVLHTNCYRRHWTLALGSFNILQFYCILYWSTFFAARTNKPSLLFCVMFVLCVICVMELLKLDDWLLVCVWSDSCMITHLICGVWAACSPAWSSGKNRSSTVMTTMTRFMLQSSSS